MKICPECRLERESAVNFCPHDGSQMVMVVCPECANSEVLTSDKFCSRCGASISLLFNRKIMEVKHATADNAGSKAGQPTTTQ